MIHNLEKLIKGNTVKNIQCYMDFTYLPDY